MNHAEKLLIDNPQLKTLSFSRYDDKLSTNLDQETIILDMTSGLYSQLNSVGSSIWEMLEQPVTFDAILNMILATYNTTREQCEAEILLFLKELVANDLIVVTDKTDS
jgi:hypothetical protein